MADCRELFHEPRGGWIDTKGSRTLSIYTTLWQLRFLRLGDACEGCEWVDVFAQGVPAHLGTPTPGSGYEAGDPYAAFLPPPLRIGVDGSEDRLRAVVFVTGDTKKGTSRAAQKYECRCSYSAVPSTRSCRSRTFTTGSATHCEVGGHG